VACATWDHGVVVVIAPQPEDPARRRPFHYRRTVVVAAPPADVWTTIVRVADYPGWWPWLQVADQSGPLVPGTVVRAVIDPPPPYSLHLDLVVDEVVAGRSIRVTVGGDLAGPARVDVDEHPAGSSVTLSWDLRPARPLLRVLAVVAHPLLAWGHEWVITTGTQQFERATGLQTLLEPEQPRRGRAGVAAVVAIAVAALAAAAAMRRRSR
jgi:hypothetical protein